MNEFNKQVFEQAAKWKCGHGCDRPATDVIEWRHQDGNRERRAVCQEHAVEDQKYWSAMSWDPGVEVSDSEEWERAQLVCAYARSSTQGRERKSERSISHSTEQNSSRRRAETRERIGEGSTR